MSDLPEMALEDVFDAAKAEEYKQRLDELWYPLVRANTSFIIAKRLMEFPSGVLLEPGREQILDLIAANFLELGALTVINMLTDKPPSLTIGSLIDWMCDNARPAATDMLRERLLPLKPDRSTDPLLERARTLRNKLLAHLDANYALNSRVRSQVLLSIGEFHELLRAANEKLRALCIGHGRSVVPMEYDESMIPPDHRSGIDWLLDLVAADSPIVNMPERQADFAPYYWKRLSEEERCIINRCRQRINLPAVEY